MSNPLPAPATANATANTLNSNNHKTLGALRHAVSKRISNGPLKLPMMPEVAGKIMSMANSPNTSLSDLSDLIHRDPALASRVLRMANSAAYGGNQTLDSLEEAVTRLGLETLNELTLSASLQAGVFRVPGFEKEIHHLWRHALASGLCGKEIARLHTAHTARIDSMFLFGLLHAIGKPVLLQTIADLQREAGATFRPEVVQTVLGEFQCEIGRRITEQWKLPRILQTVCNHYRDYARAPAFRVEVALVHLADKAAGWLIGPENISDDTLKAEPVLQELNLQPQDLQPLLENKQPLLSAVAAMEQ